MEEIKKIVKTVIGDISKKTPHQPAEIEKRWNELAEKGSAHSRILGLEGASLVVHIDSSAWLYQLNFKKPKILRELRRDFPSIEKIILKIGKIK